MGSGPCLDFCKVFQCLFRYALIIMDETLTLSDGWCEEVAEEIETGQRCVFCMNSAVPHGERELDAPPCQRCETGKETRAMLIGFWNLKNSQDSETTKFLNHNGFICVVEDETVRTI